MDSLVPVELHAKFPSAVCRKPLETSAVGKGGGADNSRRHLLQQHDKMSLGLHRDGFCGPLGEAMWSEG